MLWYKRGDSHDALTPSDLDAALDHLFRQIPDPGRILIIPPDFTRFHSQAGIITELIFRKMGNRVTDILPALGTHKPMTPHEIATMFGTAPAGLFRVHDWRNDLVTLGEVPGTYISEITGGLVSFSWPAQVNKLVAHGGHDLIISVGQVVPHEVIGMANFNKNLFVGTGGQEGINKSHFLGAVYGMERIMGRADNPVRKVLNYASEHFAKHLPVIYIQTVIGRDETGELKIRGLYIGNDETCFQLAAKLSLEINFVKVPCPLKKVIVWLDPEEFKSTWLGNKAIYRTRMAMADEGELIILAPGLKEFGEDPEIDRLIRKYGYQTTPVILHHTETNPELQQNLSAAAHLIHGSSENRFRVVYCPGSLTRDEIESVNFAYADLTDMMKKYDPARLREGRNDVDGEEIYFISNPALGLWASAERLENREDAP
jgi:nickel-dependent lactate racemase